MVTMDNVSLRELGWKLSYDIDGKYPLEEDEHIPLSPNEVITLYLRNRPTQHEDGIFYGTAIESSAKFPLFFFNMCKKKDRINTLYLFGTDGVSYPSLKGRVESFSLWSEPLDDAAILNYHTNTMSMIGDGVQYNYQTTQEALDDGLKMHYQFDQDSTVVQNFNGDTIAIKSRRFDIVDGQTSDASGLMQRKDLILIEQARFYSNFTMNFRFYIEEMDDFTLFFSKDIGFIRYNVVTGTFEVELFPHIGNAITSFAEEENLKVNTWYNFAVRYDEGEVTSVLRGDILERDKIGIDIGGAYSIIADTSNFSSIVVDSTYTFKSAWYKTNHQGYPETHEREEQQNQDFTYTHGRDAFYTMTVGEKRDMTLPRILDSWNLETYSFSPVDEINDSYKYSIYFTGAYSYGAVNFTIENFSDEGLRFKATRIYNTSSTNRNGRDNRAWTSILVPQGYVKITLTVKDILESNDPVFPVTFLVPGLPMSIHKVKMDNSNQIDYNGSSNPNSSRIEWYSRYKYYAYSSNRETAYNKNINFLLLRVNWGGLQTVQMPKGACASFSPYSTNFELLDNACYAKSTAAILMTGIEGTTQFPTIYTAINIGLK